MHHTGSGVRRSSSDGLGVVPRELFDVVRGVRDRDGVSESLHCSTSTSSSSSLPSGKRSIDAGPDGLLNYLNYLSIEFSFILEGMCNRKCSIFNIVPS